MSTNVTKIAISGSTGLIGSALVDFYASQGCEVRRIVRNKTDEPNTVYWSPDANEIDGGALAGVDAVIHLAGENIASGRWTAALKKKIHESRAVGTRLIADAIAALDAKPSVFASASAIGYYGDRGDQLMTEDSPPGEGFLAEVCKDWEAATQTAKDAGVRVVNMRIGVVQSLDGGALSRMITPFRFGVGGVVGSGEQYISWISHTDVVRAIRHVVENGALSGPVNLVAPEPVTNREYTKTLGAVIHRPTILPMPAFAARLAFGEMGEELILSSTRVSADRLTQSGFSFEHANLRGALAVILK